MGSAIRGGDKMVTAYKISARASLPLTIDCRSYRFTGLVYTRQDPFDELLFLLHGNVESQRAPLVRLHSACLTGDALGSARCDCQHQLRFSLREIVTAGQGVLLYLSTHEGRGIGLGNKIRAYALQEQGLDTVDANLQLGLEVDRRSYDGAAQALLDQGLRAISLISNNPKKIEALRCAGIDVVRRISTPGGITDTNRRYIETKRRRMLHLFENIDIDNTSRP